MDEGRKLLHHIRHCPEADKKHAKRFEIPGKVFLSGRTHILVCLKIKVDNITQKCFLSKFWKNFIAYESLNM